MSQINSSDETPVPIAGTITPSGPAPRPILTPAPAPIQPAQLTPAGLEAQIAATQSEVTVLQSQKSILQAELIAAQAALASAARPRAVPAPAIFGQPYTNTTGNIVLAHYQASNLEGGPVPFQTSGSVAGYEAEMQQAQAMGIDGFAPDFGSFTDPGYAGSIANLYTAANAVQFKLVLTPDFSGIGEDPVTMTALANFLIPYLKNPATLTINGRPVLSAYAGDGGGAASVQAIFTPFLAQIRAAGVNVFFIPDWPDVNELAAVDADGGFVFPPGFSPLGDSSVIPTVEALAASVQAAQTSAGVPLVFMSGVFPSGYGDADGRNGHFYNEYKGGAAYAAQMQSVLSVQKPRLIELLAWNDFQEMSFITSQAAAGAWSGIFAFQYPGFEPPGYWPTQAGLAKEIAYYNQWYKTGIQPRITDDTLIIYNHNQTAAAAAAPLSGTGVGGVTNASGDPPGLQTLVSWTTLTTRSGYVCLTGAGTAQQQFAPAGVAHGAFLAQAGTPTLSLKVAGQVTRQVTGQTISTAAPLYDMTTWSFASTPGISFGLTGADHTQPIDSGGLYVRDPTTTNRALGVKNLVFTDLSGPTPVVLAQQNAGLGQAALTQYNGTAYFAVEAPLAGSAPQTYQANANTDCVQWFAGHTVPAGHTHFKVECDVERTTLDNSGSAGAALVASGVNTYFGAGDVFTIDYYAGNWSINLRHSDNFTGQLDASLGSASVNSMTLGETAHLTLEYNAGVLAATVMPGNQQL